MSEAHRTALVIGITGAIGGMVARSLLRQGWRIRALSRNPSAARTAWPDEVEWIGGDTLDGGAVAAAAEGAQMLFHGANPPMYRNWREWGIPMLRNSIQAAQRHRARLVFPGNVYNFGPDAGELVAEDAPQNPATRKGEVRKEMEAMLREAAWNGQLRCLVLRAGDFFGGAGDSSWLTKVILPPNPGGPIRYPGGLRVGHAWAYLPDLAETVTRLLAMEQHMPAWEEVHFGGHWLDGAALADAIRDVLGSRSPLRGFSWLPVYLGAPFSPFLRELLEVRPLWQRPLRLDNRKLVSLIGEEPHTPLPQALQSAIGALGHPARR